MNYFILPAFRRSCRVYNNRYNLEKCLHQLQARLYYGKCESRRNNHHVNGKERIPRRKVLKAKILRDFRETKEKVELYIERENIWTIPNLLCITRIVTSPYLSYLIVSQDYKVALWFLGFAGLSDLADGWIARTWTSQASKLGSVLDPVADKLLVGSLFISLTWVNLIPVPLTMLVIARDVLLIIGTSFLRYRSLPPPRTVAKYFDPTLATVQIKPHWVSKLNTGVQLVFVAGTLAAPVFHYVDHPLLKSLCYLTAITTITGGLSYVFSKNRYKILKKKATRHS
ncbi:probable cardiolipin synthase (CMP-forming) [Leptopilina boulardi]|uniref:probable cardiolipin synthase (CMP-forming) n=1 Tax=Leptopilina boulardi TaxID=63433 RepID=UPI0021F6730F|nr:probable cardiolipin synthase (CMP-forming) [Leptopilina boulardi]